ncbi:aldo/keto reductase [Candidatus Bipolaricaulota bacterium]|nr:aldo/keto reductase [Candidatus Bipolaricaulota bacterium]
MEYRQLGRTGTRVSKLCLGTMNFVGSTDLDEARRIVDEAIDSGINFIDTADCYARGGSEEYLGIALKENGHRDDVVMATKAVATMGEGPNDHGASRYHLTRAVEASLKRLQTDRIDLFYLHITDITTPIDEILDTLDVLVRQGKILYIGTSKWPVPLIMELLALSEKDGLPRTVAEQPPYNLTDRRIEMELVWTCMRHGIGIVPFGPLAGGILSGVYRKGQPAPEGHKFKEIGQRDGHKRYTEETMDLVEKLIPLAEARGVTLAEFSLAWLMQRPGITAPICGPRTVEHLRSAVRASELQLTQEELDKVDEAIPPGGNITNYCTLYERMCRAINKPEPLGAF